jgi:hypothetical protein
MDTSQGGCGIARSVHFVKPIDLSNIPNNLLRVSDRLPFGLGVPCLGRCPRCGALPFLCSLVRTHSFDHLVGAGGAMLDGREICPYCLNDAFRHTAQIDVT